jgi:FkbM family methyltransferase
MGLASIVQFIWHNPGNRGMRLRKLACAVEWQVYKRVLRKPRIISLPNGVRFIAHPDCVISSALQYADWPEYAELQYCRRRLRSGDVLIDVGANVGHFSLLLGDLVGPRNLICYEPTPVSWRRLKANFQLNGWPTHRLHQAAVGGACGTVRFPDLNSPGTTNSPACSTAGRTVLVKRTCLDALVDHLQGKVVGLLKIDVEGAEPEVFAGGRRFLRRHRPRLVLFENLYGSPDKDIVQLLSGLGYSLFQLECSGNACLTRWVPGNFFARRSW